MGLPRAAVSEPVVENVNQPDERWSDVIESYAVFRLSARDVMQFVTRIG